MTDEAEHLCSRWFQLLPATLHVHFHLQRGLRALVMLLLQSLLLAWATCQESLVLPLWVNPFNALPILSASSLFFACFPPTLPSEEAVTLIRLTLLQARAAGCEQKAPPPPTGAWCPPPHPHHQQRPWGATPAPLKVFAWLGLFYWTIIRTRRCCCYLQAGIFPSLSSLSAAAWITRRGGLG